jgi:TolB protein
MTVRQGIGLRMPLHVHGPELATMNLLSRLIFVGVTLLASLTAQAQFRVDVSGIGLQQIPLASVVFKDEGRAPQAISDIIRADLERSGLFRNIKLADSLDENAKLDLDAIKSRGGDAALTGSVTRLADGRYDIRYRLWDAIKTQDLGGASFLVVSADLRLAAHRIADQIYEKLTGEKGVFSTRLAYVTKRGSAFTLWIADADGENAQPALNSPEPIISPSWSPNGKELAYVSFETRKPVVYVHDVSSGKRRVLANFKGSNSAPAWSPDGRTVAVTLSREGGSQIFLIPASGGEPQRLTQSSGIDTEPAFSPDGSAIYFVSDRGGSPQIYRTPARGGPVQRVTFSGNYNISPHLSPDGRWMTFVARTGGQFKVQLMDLQTEQVTPVTPTNADERPSFAPNSRLIVYATQIQGREALMTTTLDGKITARLAGQSGDIREPHWGPFQP